MSEATVIQNLLCSNIQFPWRTNNQIHSATEVKITSNRADVVFFELKSSQEIGFIAAIEAKLHDWKKAIQQAHRDKLFADRVYVAVPRRYALAPISNISEFRRVSVGLIIIDDKDKTEIYFQPPRNFYKSAKHVAKAHLALSAKISNLPKNHSIL